MDRAAKRVRRTSAEHDNDSEVDEWMEDSSRYVAE